ncbi:DUF2065 domain-containing protein [Halofilum ochraceum]|uniref:DUF2065 domain-containing protein n=1 Tax=Halofilum ochraceum TaxID=1611323 RepID=UPI00316ACFBB
MDMAWTDLGVAIALVLVIEGVMPFLAPASLRRTLATMAAMPDRSLRVVGAVSMMLGLALLYFIR